MQKFVPALILYLAALAGIAQTCENTRKIAYNNLLPYIPDGQHRKVELKQNQTKVFRTTFYGNRSYKISVALDAQEGNVRWKLKTLSGELLFDSQKTSYKPTMKLQFKSTSVFNVEIALPPEKEPGCAVIFIGFEAEE